MKLEALEAVPKATSLGLEVSVSDFLFENNTDGTRG